MGMCYISWFILKYLSKFVVDIFLSKFLTDFLLIDPLNIPFTVSTSELLAVSWSKALSAESVSCVLREVSGFCSDALEDSLLSSVFCASGFPGIS